MEAPPISPPLALLAKGLVPQTTGYEATEAGSSSNAQ